MTVVRTRFAPSPTGYLHLGSARTALFAWLFVRHHGGQFILRVEDTDVERSTEEAKKVILEAMKWMGLDYDEGPIYQTERFQRYQEVISQLLEEGKAYRCYCSRERLDTLREAQKEKKEKPCYDGHCREVTGQRDDIPYVIRFKNPLEGEVVIDDQVHRNVVFKNTELDDLIIARSDGTPTYNFTVVVDDSDMKITHVIRGDDHLNNTPRQVNILHALGFPIPVYAHVPMILGADGKKLSKRHGAVSVLQYREEGYLQEAFLNCLLRLGWSHGDQEIFSIDEMCKHFDLDSLNNSAAKFDIDKLQSLNQHYLKSLSPNSIAKQLTRFFDAANVDLNNGPELNNVIIAQCERVKTLKELAEKSFIFYRNVSQYDEKSAAKFLIADIAPALKACLQGLNSLSDWNKESIHNVLEGTVEKFALKFAKLAQALRVALTGNTISPSIHITIELLGKDKAKARIQKALDYIENI